MALNLTEITGNILINGNVALNNSTFTGQVVGTTRQAVLTLDFKKNNASAPLDKNAIISLTVLDANGKTVDIGFDSSLDVLKGAFLFNGTYIVKLDVVDGTQTAAEQAANKISKSIKIHITGCYTTLSSFEPKIINKVDGTEIVNNLVFSNGESIIPDLDQELPFDFELDEYTLSRNGLVLTYSPYGDRTISEDGEYSLTISIKRRGLELSGDIMVKQFKRTFKIQKSFIETIDDDDIFIFNAIDNAGITNGHVYVQKDVVLDWDINEGIDEKTVTLTFYPGAKAKHLNEDSNGNMTVDANYSPEILGNFERGATYLSDYGIYRLDLTLMEYNNNKNKFIVSRYFVIERDVIRLQATKIACYDGNNMQEMATSNNVLTTDAIIPAVAYTEDLGDAIDVDIIVTFNGERVKSSEFKNGETELLQPGRYDIIGRVFEVGSSESEKNQYTRTFTFIVVEPPMSMANMNPTLIHIASESEVQNGQNFIYSGDGHNFTVKSVSNAKTEVRYTYYTVTGTEMNNAAREVTDDKPLKLKEVGTYKVRIDIKDTTLNPLTNDYLYPDNVFTKTYVFSISTTDMSANDPNKLIYINGQLLDAEKKNDIWKYLSVDSVESQFVITHPGSYHILLINKHDYNFNYSMNEYFVTVVEPEFQQKAIIISDPPAGYTVKDSYRVFINFPATASGQLRFYRDANLEKGDEWKVYPDDGILCTEPCKIYARYKDTATNDYVETKEEDAFTACPTIDKNPVVITSTDITGVKNLGRYFVACPDVRRIINHSYQGYIVRPKDYSSMSETNRQKFTNDSLTAEEFVNLFKNYKCELGDLFKEQGEYFFRVVGTNTINDNIGLSPCISFTVDHTIPPEPVLKLTSGGTEMTDNDRVTESVSILITNADHSKYRYEGFLNNRVHFRTTNTSSVMTIPKVVRDGAYCLTVVAIDKESERRSYTHFNFTITSTNVAVTGIPIKPHRYYLANDGTFKFKNNIQPYDGELLIRCDSSWVPQGDVGIYRDGLVINKFAELNKEILQLEISIENIEYDVTANRVSKDALVTLKEDLYYSLLRLMVENAALETVINSMHDYVSTAEIPALESVVTAKMEEDPIYKSLRNLNTEFANMTSKVLTNYKDNMVAIITNLKSNANSIGEIYYKSKIYDAIRRK